MEETSKLTTNERLSRFIILIILILLPSPVYAQSGCCSWHGGESYCDSASNKIMCNDGTLSPTCTCSGSDSETNTNPSDNNDNTTNDNYDNDSSN